MPPKAAKRKPHKNGSLTPAAVISKNWECGLTSAVFEEDSWKVCVSLLVGRSSQDEELMGPLVLAVQKPLRRHFTCLTWDDTLAEIRELGNPSVKKADRAPMFYEVTESAKVLLDAGEEIPCDLMAKILKFQLLQIKSKDQQRMAAEQAVGEGKGKEKDGVDGRESVVSSKSLDKKAKKTHSSVEASKEKKTKLKRRNETEPPQFIDDEPENGPHHYILLLGFYNPHLVVELEGIGIYVNSVIKLFFEQQRAPDDSELSHGEPAILDTDLSCDVRQPVERRNPELFWSGLSSVLDSQLPDSKLWDVAQLSYNVPNVSYPVPTQDPDTVLALGSSVFEGVAHLIYDCLDWQKQHQHYLNNINLISVPAVVGTELLPAQASSHSRKKAVQQQQTPPEAEPPVLTTDVDMYYYSHLLDSVPPEACSVALILHCMLEQVVISTQQLASLSSCVAETLRPDDDPWSDHHLACCILQRFLPLASIEEETNQMLNSFPTVAENEQEKKRLVETFGVPEQEKKVNHPVIFRQQDERALRLKDVTGTTGFDPAEAELSILKLSPLWELIHSVNANPLWGTRKQELHFYCCTEDGVSWPEVELLFHQSVFESMPLTSVDKYGVLVNAAQGPAQHTTPSVIPWDDPLAFAKQQLRNQKNKGLTFLTEDPGNVERISLSDIQMCRRRSLHDWRYAEHHSASVLAQMLQFVSEEFRCLDTTGGSCNNTLYIFCHNPMSANRQCKEFWDTFLHTDVGFRKYLEHVADSISDWTKEQEVKRQLKLVGNLPESLKGAAACQHQGSDSVTAITDVRSQTSEEKVGDCGEQEDTLESVIREGSLKALSLEKDHLTDEEVDKKAKREKTHKGKEQKEEAENKPLSGAEKSRTKTSECAECVMTTAPPVGESQQEHPSEEVSKAFTGYSMDGKLIHVSGRLQHLFPSDGGHITVENISYTEGSSLMKVEVKIDGHCFYTHINHVVDSANTQDKDGECNKKNDFKRLSTGKQASLSAVFSNGINLSYSFYGPTGQHIRDAPVSTRVTQRERSGSSTQSSTVCEDQPPPPSCPFNSLSFSVPSGLLLQFLREDAQDEQSVLVKQSFPLHQRRVVKPREDFSLSSEISRVITSQGAVICYKRDGSTQVLFADGSVSVSQEDSGLGGVSDSEANVENAPQEGLTLKSGADPQTRCWLTTTPSGSHVYTVGTTNQHVAAAAPPLLVYKFTDPITHDVMLTREDHIVFIHYSDGSVSVEHADGTRITSLSKHGQSTVDHLEHASCPSDQESTHGRTECVQATRFAHGVLSKPEARLNSDTGDKTNQEKTCEKECVAEKVVLVEKEGYATVEVYPERCAAHVFLADGTIITGNSHGAYQVFHSTGGLLDIQINGKCVYSPVRLASPKRHGGAATNEPGSYTMSQADNVVCDITDTEGNHFQVMEDGQISVLNVSPVGSTQRHDDEEQENEENPEMRRWCVKDKHCLRLFLVYEDGSGTELLSSQTVAELLNQSFSDPTVQVLKEPLPSPQTEGDVGITILKPGRQSIWSQWLRHKHNSNMAPPNFTNRTWHSFPQSEKKIPGPPFGSDLGRGLTLRDDLSASEAQHQPLRSCPQFVELRILYQYRPFPQMLQTSVHTGLKNYIKSLMEREERYEMLKVHNHQTDEEGDLACNLLSLLLSLRDEEDARDTLENSSSGDIAALYSQGVKALEESNLSEEPTLSRSAMSSGLMKENESKWPERLAQHRQELCKMTARRKALKKKSSVPYFHPENVQLYQGQTELQTADRRSPLMDQPLTSKAKPAETFLSDNFEMKTSSEAGSDAMTASMARLTSPRVERIEIFLTDVPQETSERNVGSSVQCQSVQLDVTGKPRQAAVRLPSCILSAKPQSVQFLSVEEPVRRKCRTVSLSNPNTIIRGFQLLPCRVDFGTVWAGTSSAVTVMMKNVGVDTCRFHVEQPPPATGLQIIYKPGPVAAGLQIELLVQLFANSAVHSGEIESKNYICQDITIRTERDILYLPVTATVLPEKCHDLSDCENTRSHRKKDSRSASSSPPFKQGLIWPARGSSARTSAARTGHSHSSSSL
ncbi:sperm-associated antigen 17 [Thalassophryne amazonica]|uniref:sperm-associated antigen 17 n=1 Tax=Thalassophryne amazonica TaxID=390379 RepID=UPI001470C945|nr:sperm-associated antigen 17 [Thalassophryne amazonica]